MGPPRLELGHLAVPEPKSGVSTNSTTGPDAGSGLLAAGVTILARAGTVTHVRKRVILVIVET
jgi:hypothetical protein